jgi:predicted small metal-binding protein
MARHLKRIEGKVEATCSFCNWTVSGKTWRPVRRKLAEHLADKHATVKVVV